MAQLANWPQKIVCFPFPFESGGSWLPQQVLLALEKWPKKKPEWSMWQGRVTAQSDVVAVFSPLRITSQFAAFGINPQQSSWLQRNCSRDSHVSLRTETGPHTEDTKSVPWVRASGTEVTVHFGVPAEEMDEPLVFPGIPTSCWTERHQADSCKSVLQMTLFSLCLLTAPLIHFHVPGSVTEITQESPSVWNVFSVRLGFTAPAGERMLSFLQHASPRKFSWSWLKLQA